MVAVTIFLITIIIIISLLFGYNFGKSVGITMAINYIEDKYTNKNKQISNIFKGILNTYNNIKIKCAKPIIIFLLLFGINCVMLILLFLYYEFQC